MFIPKIKQASTIMLAREKGGIVEVLLLKRNKALAFAGGLWVFPGGKIESSEIEESENELEAAKLAAVRETKEEANLDIDPNSLIFFRHWTTPVIEPRRYATYFFFGAANVSTKVTIDDSEIKEHCWINPQAALDRFSEGKLAMMPPTLMSLQLIRKCKTITEIEELLRKETPIFILPVLQRQGRKMICMYKGDAGYALRDAEVVGARHRLVIDMFKGTAIFEFSDCEGVLPINGGMHL